MIDLDDVAYLQANGNYTQIEYVASHGPLLGLGLSKVEQLISRAFPPGKRSPMVRLGRSLIINQRYLLQINLVNQKLVLGDNCGNIHTLSAPKPLLKQYKELLQGHSQKQAQAKPTEK